MAKISHYFTGIASKKLSAVETSIQTSNQHEFNGIKSMGQLFGEVRKSFEAKFIYFGNYDDDTSIDIGRITWYDARENHPTRSEFRLYFQGSSVMDRANVGDLLVLALRPSGEVLVLIAKSGTTLERQVLWLFGIEESDSFTLNTMEGDANKNIGYSERIILETLGIEVSDEEPDKWLDIILNTFGETFPSTKLFSKFARDTIKYLSVIDEPDQCLLAWLMHEEMLFRTLERHIVEKKLSKGFIDVDDFVSYSLSIQNKRKSRAGFALENHLAFVFQQHSITFSQGKTTENNSKPDFIFPGILQYNDPAFPTADLTMLGSKSSCKDRWRQVLSEARRIDKKHLFTLEPGISQNQTEEMKDHKLQLVLPAELHKSYLPEQQEWLMNLGQFIDLVTSRQNAK